MANIANIKLISDNKEQNLTKVVIITSVDDDNDTILSYLKPTNVVDLNNTDMMEICERNTKDNRRTLSQLEQELFVHPSRNMNFKKRKADLTCVVCGGKAIGYNFAQITCESCKAFFRRNATNSMERTRFTKYRDNLEEVRCDIRYDVRHKCQRCRLMKCFRAGMRKDYILTPKEKQLKNDRLDDNRRIRSEQTTKSSTFIESPTTNEQYKPLITIPQNSSSSLNDEDWSCLNHIRNAYFTASQSIPSASSVISLELAPDQMSAFMSTIDRQNFAAVKLINFLREIPEFVQLDERDRLILVKYNLTLLFILCRTLTLDIAREICYDLDKDDVVSPTEEVFAHYCESLFILCDGYEFNRIVMSILHSLVNIVNKDPILVQLLMLIMIFSKGVAADDDQEPILNNDRSVFNAQAKYTDLLFRYLMNQSSLEIVVNKMRRIVEQLFKIQKVSRDFQQYIKSEVDLTHINPLMKSLLHLT